MGDVGDGSRPKSVLDELSAKLRVETDRSAAKRKISDTETMIISETANAKIERREPELAGLQRTLAATKAELQALEQKYGIRRVGHGSVSGSVVPLSSRRTGIPLNSSCSLYLRGSRRANRRCNVPSRRERAPLLLSGLPNDSGEVEQPTAPECRAPRLMPSRCQLD